MTDSLTFDTYRRSADRDSEAWATSDRGWAFVPEVTSKSFAHYLDYAGTGEQGKDGKRVHVVVCGVRGLSWCAWVKRVSDAHDAIRAAYRHARRHDLLDSR